MSADVRLARLLTMVPWLVANPGVRWEQVAQRFHLSKEELFKDLELLDNCALPGGGYLDMVEISYLRDEITVEQPQALNRPLQLTAEEAVALLAAGTALLDLPGVSSQDLGTALATIAGLVGQAPPEVELPQDDPVATTVLAALSGARQLRITHRSESRTVDTDRVVSPVQLVMRQGTPYLEAWCHTSGGARLFRLDRISHAELLDAPASPQGERLEVDDQGFVRRLEQPTATLELDRSARWVAQEQPMTVLQDRPDGSLLVAVPVADRAWLVRLVLRLGGRGRVLEPTDLAAEVRDLARAALTTLQA